jgi:hypothetical protein
VTSEPESGTDVTGWADAAEVPPSLLPGPFQHHHSASAVSSSSASMSVFLHLPRCLLVRLLFFFTSAIATAASLQKQQYLVSK